MAGPGRQPTSRDVLHVLSGNPVFLGALVSTGAAVSNLTTATPFSTGMPGAAQPNFLNTLSGKTLLIQPTGAGFFLPSLLTTLSIAAQTFPIAQNTMPGVAISEGERVVIEMLPGSICLQWLPFVSANLLVWELL